MSADTTNLVIPGHPLWDNFVKVLGGPDFCNFRKVNGETRWTCKGGKNKDFAIKILTAVKVPKQQITETLAYFEAHGGYCDCEILFNVDGPHRSK